jgi:hypothetical protein
MSRLMSFCLAISYDARRSPRMTPTPRSQIAGKPVVTFLTREVQNLPERIPPTSVIASSRHFLCHRQSLELLTGQLGLGTP